MHTTEKDFFPWTFTPSKRPIGSIIWTKPVQYGNRSVIYDFAEYKPELNERIEELREECDLANDATKHFYRYSKYNIPIKAYYFRYSADEAHFTSSVLKALGEHFAHKVDITWNQEGRVRNYITTLKEISVGIKREFNHPTISVEKTQIDGTQDCYIGIKQYRARSHCVTSFYTDSDEVAAYIKMVWG